MLKRKKRKNTRILNEDKRGGECIKVKVKFAERLNCEKQVSKNELKFF